MNKELRYAHICNRWSQLEIFLAYLRVKGCFTHSNKDRENDANPYWYGTIYKFDIGDVVIKDLIKTHGFKISRLKKVAEMAKNDDLSPIVRLVGLGLERILEKYK